MRQTGLKIFRNIVVNGEVKAELQAHVLNAAQMRQKGLGIFAPENNQPAFFETDILALRWVERVFPEAVAFGESVQQPAGMKCRDVRCPAGGDYFWLNCQSFASARADYALCPLHWELKRGP